VASFPEPVIDEIERAATHSFQYFPFDVVLRANVSKLIPPVTLSLLSSYMSRLFFFFLFLSFFLSLSLSCEPVCGPSHCASRKLKHPLPRSNHDLENGLSYVPSYIKVFRMQSHFACLPRHNVVSVATLSVFMDTISNFRLAMVIDIFSDLAKKRLYLHIIIIFKILFGQSVKLKIL